jgi:hypothetical protein
VGLAEDDIAAFGNINGYGMQVHMRLRKGKIFNQGYTEDNQEA